MEELSHSAKGTTWGKHKYIAIRNGRYIYPGDKVPGSTDDSSEINAHSQNIRRSTVSSTNTPATFTGNGRTEASGGSNNYAATENTKSNKRPRGREKKIVEGSASVFKRGRTYKSDTPAGYKKRVQAVNSTIKNDERAKADLRKAQLIALASELEKKGYRVGSVEARLNQMVANRRRFGRKAEAYYKYSNKDYKAGKAKVARQNKKRELQKQVDNTKTKISSTAKATASAIKSAANKGKTSVSSAMKSASMKAKVSVNKGKNAVSSVLSKLSSLFKKRG